MITCSTNNQEKGDSIPGFILALRSIFRKIYISSLRPVTLLKKGFWHRCFPVNFAKFFRTPFYIIPAAASERLFKKVIFKNFTKLTGKHFYQKVTIVSLQPAPLLKKTSCVCLIVEVISFSGSHLFFMYFTVFKEKLISGKCFYVPLHSFIKRANRN